MMNTLLEALFPEVCMVCKRLLYEQEQHICLYCLHSMPRTDFFQRKENELFLRLANRIPISSAQSLFYFHKKNKSQQFIHSIKYHPYDTRAFWFGALMGKVWIECHSWKPDAIVPVPLHPKRQRERGYNQSEALARGYASSTGVPVCADVLVRKIYKQSQTQKGKDARWEDLQEAYGLNREQSLSDKKVLLLDDIVTTGATIEICGQLLTEMNVAEIHVYSLSVAMGL